MCHLRWTVRTTSLYSVLDNYTVHYGKGATGEISKHSEIRSRIVGVQTQMSRFDFLFEVSLGYELLRHTDNLRKTLHHKDISAAKGKK